VGAGASLPLITDQWVELRLEIDLEGDNQAFYYDNQFLYQGSWAEGVSGGGILNIGAVDLFANGASSVYYDDLSLVQSIPNPCDFPADLPWLNVLPDTGLTPPGGSDLVGVGFDSTGLGIGTYEGTLCVTSNDLVTPLVEVPVSMTVTTDPPMIEVSPASIETTQFLTSVVTTTLTLSNTGGSDLDWSIFEDNTSLRMPLYPGYAAPALVTPRPVTIGDAQLSANPNPATSVKAPAGAVPAFEITNGLTLTHSADQSILAGNSVHCGYTGLPYHTDNSYIRRFDLNAFGILGNFDVSLVQVGIEDATGGAGSQPGTINLYAWDSTTPFTFGNFTLLGTTNVSIPDQALTILNVPVSGVAPAGSTLVVEFFTPDGFDASDSLYPGSNNLGQTDATFLAAADCGLTEPLDTAAIGFPGMHLVMNVVGIETSTTCDVPDDIPWASFSPMSGTTLAGEASLVDVAFDSTGLSTGTYTATACVTSNDPFNSLVSVPLTMTVELEPARLQVAHLAPFAMDPSTAVTVTLNGTPVLTDFAYTDSTVYLDVTPGSYLVEIFPDGSPTPAITGTVDLMSGMDYTAIAIGDGANQPLSLLALVDDNTAPAAGNFKLRLGHLAPFANTLAGTMADIRLDDGTAVLTNVVFGAVSPYLELPAGTYDLKITTPGGGTTLINLAPVTFVDGQILSAFATGDGVNQPLGGYALPSDQLGFVLPLEGYKIYLPLAVKN
jgi:hypothetical protein